MTNILLPSNSGIERTNLFCPAGCGHLIRGIGPMTGRALCQSCGYTVTLDEAPESNLTDSHERPFLVQPSRRKKDWEDDLPAGVTIIEETTL